MVTQLLENFAVGLRGGGRHAYPKIPIFCSPQYFLGPFRRTISA
jgi:hypothetical protein